MHLFRIGSHALSIDTRTVGHNTVSGCGASFARHREQFAKEIRKRPRHRALHSHGTWRGVSFGEFLKKRFIPLLLTLRRVEQWRSRYSDQLSKGMSDQQLEQKRDLVTSDGRIWSRNPNGFTSVSFNAIECALVRRWP
jgi:hypothetical protein